MPALCHKHQHSSPQTAAKCWEETMRRKVARMERHRGTPEMIRYKLVKYSPPLEVGLNGIKVFYFFRGEQK